MTNFRRFSTALAATLMAATLSVPMMSSVTASAADITITAGDSVERSYEAYQIFSGTLSTGSVLSDIQWGSGILNPDSVISDVKGTGLPDDTFPFANCETAAEVAKVLVDSKTNEAVIKAFAARIEDVVDPNKAIVASGKESVKLDVEEDGYYLVRETTTLNGVEGAMTRYILQVAGTDINVDAKSSYPTVMKKVQEESLIGGDDETVTFGGGEYNLGDGYNDVADYDIGDSVPFKLYGTMPSTIDDYPKYQYKFTDKIGSQFTLDRKTVDQTVKVSAQNGDSITVINSEDIEILGTDDGFTVYFDDVKSIKDAEGKAITVNKDTIIIVEYEATLNNTANVGYTGQVNGVYLEYSNNPNIESGGTTLSKTPEDGVIVFTYGIDINKVDANSADKLAGAKFAVYYETTEEVDGDSVTKRNYIKTDETTNCFSGILGTAPTATTEVGNANGVWVSGADGNIIIKGLDKDKTYYIEELAAPAGYNKLTAPVEVVLDSVLVGDDEVAESIYQQNWTYNTAANAKKDALDKITINVNDAEEADLVADDDDDLGTVTIENSAGSSLPGTGGIGTAIFTLGGGAMVAIAGIYLISKKRMKNEEE